jgi:hypothetical protein
VTSVQRVAGPVHLLRSKLRLRPEAQGPSSRRGRTGTIRAPDGSLSEVVASYVTGRECQSRSVSTLSTLRDMLIIRTRASLPLRRGAAEVTLTQLKTDEGPFPGAARLSRLGLAGDVARGNALVCTAWGHADLLAIDITSVGKAATIGRRKSAVKRADLCLRALAVGTARTA